MTEHRLFFSYRTKDANRVRNLKDNLRRLLPNLPFLDASESVPYSDDWKTAASTTIESCDALICIVSSDTHESEPVDWEVREAHRLGKPVLVALLSGRYALPKSCGELRIEVIEWDAAGVAARIGELLLHRLLFARRDGSISDPDPNLLWNQYSLMVRSWESLIARRQTVNTLYITADAALLTGIGVLVSAIEKTGMDWGSAAIAFVSLTGVALSANWRRTVTSYGTLSLAKSKVVAALEEHMPARLFDAEWRVLEARRYRSTTDLERQTALFLSILFAALALTAVGVLVGRQLLHTS